MHVPDVELQLQSVPYIFCEGSHTLDGVIHAELWEVKPEPVIVIVTSPLLGALTGRMSVATGEAATGAPAAIRRNSRIRQAIRIDPLISYSSG